MQIFNILTKFVFDTNTNPDKLSPLHEIVKWNILILFTKTFPKFVLHIYMHIFSHVTANFRGTVVHNHCICGHIHSLWGQFDIIYLGIYFIQKTQGWTFKHK